MVPTIYFTGVGKCVAVLWGPVRAYIVAWWLIVVYHCFCNGSHGCRYGGPQGGAESRTLREFRVWAVVGPSVVGFWGMLEDIKLTPSRTSQNLRCSPENLKNVRKHSENMFQNNSPKYVASGIFVILI